MASSEISGLSMYCRIRAWEGGGEVELHLQFGEVSLVENCEFVQRIE
jgi:hypothetical protein